MKKLILILVTVCCSSVLVAQNHTFFPPQPENARWTYLKWDADGNLQERNFYAVESMTGDAVNGKAVVNVEIVSVASPTDTLKTKLFYRFEQGECILDMGTIFESEAFGKITKDSMKDAGEYSQEELDESLRQVKEKMKFTGEVRGVPQYPEVGKLPDYEFRMKLMFVSMTIKGNQRKITGQELVQTPAGDFNCFVLSENITTKAMMQRELQETTSWYAYGIGLVKQMVYNDKGDLESVTLLETINW